MIDDPYFSHEYSVERLLAVYNKHKTIIIALDFDETFYDCHKKEYTFSKVISLIKECNELNFTIIIFTASKVGRYPLMLDYCNQIGIKIDGINVNPSGLPEGMGTNGKIYYNLLLDDKAGLYSAYLILRETVMRIKAEIATKPSIINAIEKAFAVKQKRNWDLIYFFFDIHETILYPDYNNTDPKRFYKDADIVLQYLSTRNDVELGLYTCSYPEEIDNYITFFSEHNIKFHHVNENLKVGNTTYGYYEDKPYFNVLWEDKAGFNAEKDWTSLRKYFNI
jgi:hypothetical protein